MMTNKHTKQHTEVNKKQLKRSFEGMKNGVGMTLEEGLDTR